MAPSMIACLSIARAMARRTRTSSRGGRAPFMARMVSPSVVPTTTSKRGSASSARIDSGEGMFGKASTSPDMRLVTAVAGSGMMRKVARASAGASPQ